MPFYSFILYLLFVGGCNFSASSKDFREVNFSAGLCEGTCPEFSITINNTGASTYVAGMFNTREGKFTSHIQPARLDSLKQLLHNAGINNLPESYSSQATDLPSYRLQVSFMDGTVKTIDDYGPAGPYTLQQLYNFMFSLRDSQDWK